MVDDDFIQYHIFPDAFCGLGWHEWAVCLANGYLLRGYFELAGMRINNRHSFDEPTNSHTEMVSFSPVIRFHPKFGLQWYVDLSVGLAYFTKDQIATRNLGSHVVFEDRFGFGALFGKKQEFEIGYRAIHYSNAYLAKVNQGLNIQMLLIGYWF